MKIQNVRGSYDYLPKEQRIRNYIIDILKETFMEFCYQNIETPILCYYDMLSDKYDEENDILKEIYTLTDQGNRDLGLRYDLTVPFAKFIALNKNKITFPFKRYEINKVFRDGPIKKGRDREFTQCDCDIVGNYGQLVEAELLDLYVKAFKRLDIDIIIKYNSRKLMTGLIIESGINIDKVDSVTTIIDKKDKLSNEEFNEMLINIGLNNEQIENLSNYFECDLDKLNQEFISSNNYLKEGLDELNELNKYINTLNIQDKCLFDITLARGQNYYTGNVFEVYEKNKKITCSIGGGGRYDKMITEFISDGSVYPAVGISFGLSSIYELIKDRDIFNNEIDIYLIPMNTDIESLKLASKLRDLKYKVEIDMNNRKLKKSLDYANKEDIPYVIILGSNEVDNNIFKLKDMKKGTEYSIDNINKLKEII